MVTTQDQAISMTLFHFTAVGSLFSPAPMIAPVATWVVETGRLAQDAADTRAAVAMLAVSDSASGSGVSFFDSVSSTRRPLINPPSAIATVTMANPIAAGFDAFAALSATML